MFKSLITALAFVLISTSLAIAGPRCAKQVGNICLKERIAVTCCCRVAGGGSCCAEQQACMGGMVFGCMCSNFYNDEGQVTRVSIIPLDK
jgi:hypothetical protein